jgi:phage host-nuclease inhibitor protein Gam
MQGELKLKEAIIEEQRSKILKARAKVKKLHDQLVTNKQKTEAEYMSKCNEFKAEYMKLLEEQERLMNEKVKLLEEAYQNQIKEMKKEMKKKHSS